MQAQRFATAARTGLIHRRPFEKIGRLNIEDATKGEHDFGRDPLPPFLETQEAHGGDICPSRQGVEGKPALHAPFSQTGADESIDRIRIGHRRHSLR
ncbi:hypothetical protein M2323_003821 [Rhodoblastus acidophilus]|nr:hypothetical protein [Rhodoblastus acidophilus]MCW2285984.1 hypothetical protein [Rhodoblastus acidophilus]MCW2334878.1 hypothetical protein [Rhodoblastus acidophilus]